MPTMHLHTVELLLKTQKATATFSYWATNVETTLVLYQLNPSPSKMLWKCNDMQCNGNAMQCQCNVMACCQHGIRA